MNLRTLSGQARREALVVEGARERERSFGRSLALALKAYMPLWLLVLAYGTVTWHLTGQLPDILTSPTSMLLDLGVLLITILPAFVVWRLVHWALHGLPKSPLRQLLADARAIFAYRSRLVNLAVLFPVFYLFLKFFAVFKGNIAYLQHFAWDETLATADSWLHGGRQPWEWLWPFLSSGPATFTINFIYNFWYFVAIGSLLWAVGMRRVSEDAIRFLFAFLFIWAVGGSLLALVFSSAGPVFYEHLGLSPDPYVKLVAHLRALNESWPIWAVDTQDLLWRQYLEQNITLGGISAFPSMHNAQATLVALFAWRFGRRAGWLFTAYAAAIAIGSVWLGWHYAVDAYAGVALAIIGWWLARPLTRWMLRRPVMRRFARLQRRLDSAR